MEGFRFFEAVPVDVGWHQPSSTASLLAAGNRIQHVEGKKERGQKFCKANRHIKISCC